MRAPLAALAGIGGSAAVVFSTAVLPLPLFLRVAHWFPSGDPRLVVLTVQALGLALVLVVLKVPIRSLLRGWPPRPGLTAGSWLTLGTLLFSLLVSMTIVSTSGFDARSGTASTLARWAREFPSTGLAGHFVFYSVFVPVFEELLYRGLILGYLLRLLPPWLALAVSALLFAAGHPSWFFSGLSGVAYGLLYLRYRNLWLCVLTPQCAQSRFFGRGDPAGRLSARQPILDADGDESASASTRLDFRHPRVLRDVPASRVCEDGRRAFRAAAWSAHFRDAGHDWLMSSSSSLSSS